MAIFKSLKPNYYYKKAFDIDFQALKEEGIKLILSDWDNTLMPHGSLDLNEYGKSVVDKVRQAGLELILFSNAKTARIKTVSLNSGLEHVKNPRKPILSGIEKFLSSRSDLSKEEVVIVGDQLFTDILAGKRAGIKTVLVEAVSKDEPLQIKLKRILEKLFIKGSPIA